MIARRLEKTRELIAGREANAPTPRGRLSRFVGILRDNGELIMLRLPFRHPLHRARQAGAWGVGRGGRTVRPFRDWLAGQFRALGRDADAETLALHLLMRSQGVAVLFNAYRDPAFVDREVAAMEAWIDAVTAGAHADAN